MAQNVVPAKAAESKRKPDHAVKRDLNLATPKPSHEHAARAVAYTFLVLLLLGLGGIAAVWLPSMKLDALERSVMGVQNEMIPYQKAEADFGALNAQKKAAESIVNDVQALGTNYIHPKDMLDMLNRTCPDTIVLDSITYTQEGLTVLGIAQSDTDIAQFLENIKNTGIFATLSLRSVATTEEELLNVTENSRIFELNMALAPVAAPETAAPEQNGEGGANP